MRNGDNGKRDRRNVGGDECWTEREKETKTKMDKEEEERKKKARKKERKGVEPPMVKQNLRFATIILEGPIAVYRHQKVKSCREEEVQ